MRQHPVDGVGRLKFDFTRHAAGLNVFTISPDRARSIARATWTEGRFRRMNLCLWVVGQRAALAAMASSRKARRSKLRERRLVVRAVFSVEHGGRTGPDGSSRPPE